MSTEDINLRYDSEKFSLVEITAQTQTLSQQNYSVATLKAAFSDSMVYGESAVIVLEKDGERLATFTMVYALLTTAEMIPQSTDLVVSKNNNTFVEFTVLTNAEEMYGYDFQTDNVPKGTTLPTLRRTHKFYGCKVRTTDALPRLLPKVR